MTAQQRRTIRAGLRAALKFVAAERVMMVRSYGIPTKDEPSGYRLDREGQREVAPFDKVIAKLNLALDELRP